MATNRDLLKEAIADAKAVKETAIANAKAALSEAFTPQLNAIFAAKLQEMEKEEDLEEMYGESEDEKSKMEEAGFGPMTNVKGHGNIEDESSLYEDEMVDEIDLEELLKELELEEGEVEETLNEAEEEEEEDMEMSDEESEEGEEEGEPLDLEDMTDEDLKSMIEDVIKDMIKDGELEAGDESEEGGEETEEMGIEDDEIDLAELLREIEEMDSLEEAKKYGGNKGDEKRDDMKKEKEGHGKGPKKKDTAEDEKEIDYKKKLKEELEEAYSAIETLKAELNEINLLNAKLLYTNKIFKSKNLNENQKVKVLSSFDKATTVGEVKMVFETLNEGIKVSKSTIKENLGRASKATVTPNAKKPIVESNEAFLRMQKLAGII